MTQDLANTDWAKFWTSRKLRKFLEHFIREFPWFSKTLLPCNKQHQKWQVMKLLWKMSQYFRSQQKQEIIPTSHQRGTDNYQGSLDHLKSIQYYFKLKILVYYFLKPSVVCREDRESAVWDLISSLWCNVERDFLQDKGNIFITEILSSRGECLQLLFSFPIFEPTLENSMLWYLFYF